MVNKDMSATYKSKKILDKWLKYVKCRVTDCITTVSDKGHVDGVVEADEVIFAGSLKGTKPSNMLRHSRKRQAS